MLRPAGGEVLRAQLRRDGAVVEEPVASVAHGEEGRPIGVGEGIGVRWVDADEATPARRGAADLPVLEDLHPFAAQEEAPIAFLVRGEAQPPSLLAIVEAVDHARLARGRNE